jgi:penicillin-binding protein 1A
LKQKAKKKLSLEDWIKRFWIAFVGTLVFHVLFFTALSLGWLGFMPSFEELEAPPNYLATEIISADQKQLGTFYVENRLNVHYSDLSPWVVKALIATEDARFQKHSGIDGKALLRVIYGMITNTD